MKSRATRGGRAAQIDEKIASTATAGPYLSLFPYLLTTVSAPSPSSSWKSVAGLPTGILNCRMAEIWHFKKSLGSKNLGLTVWQVLTFFT